MLLTSQENPNLQERLGSVLTAFLVSIIQYGIEYLFGLISIIFFPSPYDTEYAYTFTPNLEIPIVIELLVGWFTVYLILKINMDKGKIQLQTIPSLLTFSLLLSILRLALSYFFIGLLNGLLPFIIGHDRYLDLLYNQWIQVISVFVEVGAIAFAIKLDYLIIRRIFIQSSQPKSLEKNGPLDSHRGFHQKLCYNVLFACSTLGLLQYAASHSLMRETISFLSPSLGQHLVLNLFIVLFFANPLLCTVLASRKSNWKGTSWQFVLMGIIGGFATCFATYFIGRFLLNKLLDSHNLLLNGLVIPLLFYSLCYCLNLLVNQFARRL
ncbi:hypothetical protein [Olivibacter sitiensis]|uniref:hypothetical protein n=1 Tax=Olivibacter sitiensis TaxID=376470 RepID=UPI0003F8AECE|nr:hypothetical protein [Olivibacter sitiensis]